MIDPVSSLSASIRELERHIEGEDGLPEELFLLVSRITPLINVDLLVQDDSGRTLLTWRSDRFYGPGWHVPGGVIRYKEPAANRIRKVAEHELGVAVEFDPAPFFVNENIRQSWQDRAHFVSLLYRCRLAGPLDQRRRFTPESPMPDQWLWHERCPENLIPEQRAYAAFIG